MRVRAVLIPRLAPPPLTLGNHRTASQLVEERAEAPAESLQQCRESAKRKEIHCSAG